MTKLSYTKLNEIKPWFKYILQVFKSYFSNIY